MGRPPPGGACTFSFGEAPPAPKVAAPTPVDTESKFPKEQREKIQALMMECTSAEELVKKMQTEMGLNGQASGGEDSGLVPGTRGFKPAGQKVQSALDALLKAFSERGCDSFVRLGKKFHIMDDDMNKGLCFEEFKKGLKESKVVLEEPHLQALFRTFDSNCSGYITFDEFMLGVRPEMPQRRRRLILQVFHAMDSNADGALTVEDVSGRYDCSLHPDVIAGTATEVQVLSNFLSGFDGSLGVKSAVVTPEKFLAYYANVSASIDDDDYFELMVRNVWHMSGGEGAAACTTCKRLLVTHEDGTQTVEVIEDDFDVSKDDLKAIKDNLREQGVPVSKVSMYGYVEDGDATFLTSVESPTKAAEAEKPTLDEADPEVVAAAYKQRMVQSNVTFS